MTDVYLDLSENVTTFYKILISVPRIAECPHGTGRVYAGEDGFRITCPQEKNCWFLKWESREPPVV